MAKKKSRPASKPKHKVGDEVTIGSSGQEMVINEIKDDIATCEWLDAQGKPHSRKYHLDALKPYKPEDYLSGGPTWG